MSSWLRQIRTTSRIVKLFFEFPGWETLLLDQPQSRGPYLLLRHRHIEQLSTPKTCIAADTAVL
jgi:hypothetical protein